ncbi:hypothetical protein V6N11_075675 [Hibiscus sabdariffa]|uniref:WAT1-related protein n=1 Tax=Hibiscus sabdariffa TaxID=183260 RepID=A0ABR2N712_9ROSI
MVEHMRDVAAFTVMVIMEACTIALTILAKTALTGGLSPFVLVVYTNAVASSLLLPFSFLYHRRERTQQSLFPFPLLLRMFFLGLSGIAVSQNLAFLGLSYSSPIVVCATGLLLPSISFFLSIILRTTKLGWGSSGCQAKLIGTLISITGIIVVELYGGPFIPTSPVSLAHPLQLIPIHFVFYSTPDRWVLGGLLLAAANLSLSILNIIQGTFGSIIRSNVHLTCTRMKGPFYVPMFKPCGILFATIFGTSFFTNSLQYGREKVNDVSNLEAPLLQEQEEEAHV